MEVTRRSPTRRRGRRVARLLLPLLVAGLALPTPAGAEEPSPDLEGGAPSFPAPAASAPANAAIATPRIRFPVDGPVSWTDTFGACRDGCSRSHEGQDLMADKLQPILAARSGRVTWMQKSASDGNYVFIQAKDGWIYGYIHINNDTPGTDDGANPDGWIFGPNVEPDGWVRKGQIVGFVGDSGNAEATSSHLHFEIRTENNVAINAASALNEAERWSTGARWGIHTGFAGAGPDRWFPSHGRASDVALACDTDGNGIDQPVLFRGNDEGRWIVRTTAMQQGVRNSSAQFGKLEGDQPVCGDWDGDGRDTLGILRKGGLWLLSDRNKDPRPYWTFRFGNRWSVPVVGDWDKDGKDEPGVYLASRGEFVFRSGVGKGADNVGRVDFGGKPGDIPIAGDWNDRGVDSVGVVRGGRWLLTNSLSSGEVDRRVAIPRSPGDQPIAGVWNKRAAHTPAVHHGRPFA